MPGSGCATKCCLSFTASSASSNAAPVRCGPPVQLKQADEDLGDQRSIVALLARAMIGVGHLNIMNQQNQHQSIPIAVINSSEDTVDMLRTCLQQEGFTSVVTTHVTDIKRGREDIIGFLATHDPQVLVYDVSIPYEENWNFLRLQIGRA